MACLDTLSSDQARQAINLCIAQAVPATVTVRRRNRWLTYQTRILAQFEDFLWIAYPTLNNAAVQGEFPVREQLGLTFRVGHRRHVFPVVAMGREVYTLEGQREQIAMKVTFPEAMHRAERRLRDRIDLPARAVARASFWLGGRVGQPAAASVSAPIWSGRVMNMSLGGIYIRADLEAARYIEVGDLAGVRVTFGGQTGEGVVVDATFRHAERDGDMVLMGFQFAERDSPEETVDTSAEMRKILDPFR